MNKRFLLALIFGVSSISVSAQKEFNYSRSFSGSTTVENTQQEVEGTARPAYSVTLNELTSEEAWKATENYFGSFKGTQASKKPLVIDNAQIKEISDSPVRAFISVKPGRNDQSHQVVVSFLQIGGSVGPVESPEAHKGATNVMRDFAVSANREVVESQIDEVAAAAKDLEKEVKGFEKDIAKREKSIKKSEKKLDKANKERESLNNEIDSKQKAIADFESKIGDDRSPDKLKQLQDMRSELQKAEKQRSKLLKDEIGSRENQAELKDEPAVNEKEMQEKSDRLKELEQLRKDLEKKLKSIK